MAPTPLTNHQWQSVVKALAYSFGSGFVGGLILGATSFLQSGASAGTHALTALVVAGVVGGLNTLAVFVKQLFSEE